MLQNIEMFALIYVGVVIVGTGLMANIYRNSHGSWPDKKRLLLFIRILLVAGAVGGAVGWFLGKRG
jgi:hypothetical protein